jgi:glycerol dehydrogenase
MVMTYRLKEMDWIKPQLPFVWKSPAIYVQGPEASKDTGKYCGHLGKKAFIMGGTTALKIAGENVRNSLAENGVEVADEYPGVWLCSDTENDKVTEAAKASEADFIVGVGGGSMCDVARRVANNVDMGGKLVLVGTVASMAGFTSALSVIYNDDLTWNRYDLYPEDTHAVIMDSKIIAEGPVSQTINGMGDAMCIKFEMEASKQAETPTLVGGYSTVSSRLIANECWNQLREFGVQALAANRHKVVTPALERIIETNTLMAGVGFESGGLAGGHGIHDGLVGAGLLALHRKADRHIPHGQVISFTTITQMILEDRPSEEIWEAIAWADSVGLSITFEDLMGKGVSPDLDLIWAGACKSCMQDKVLLLGATPVSPARVYSALLTADELGNKFREEIKPNW